VEIKIVASLTAEYFKKLSELSIEELHFKQ
jgi:hypothetical protein